MRNVLLLGVLLLALELHAQPRQQLEFVGVAMIGATMQLRVVDHSTDTAQWVALGESFCGFTIAGYDAESETLRLRREGLELRLRLRDARSRVLGDLPTATAAAIQANLKLLVAAAKIHFLEGRSGYATFDDLVGPDRPLPQLPSVAGEDYRSLTFMKAEAVTLGVRTASGHHVTYLHDPAR